MAYYFDFGLVAEDEIIVGRGGMEADEGRVLWEYMVGGTTVGTVFYCGGV